MLGGGLGAPSVGLLPSENAAAAEAARVLKQSDKYKQGYMVSGGREDERRRMLRHPAKGLEGVVVVGGEGIGDGIVVH